VGQYPFCERKKKKKKKTRSLRQEKKKKKKMGLFNPSYPDLRRSSAT